MPNLPAWTQSNRFSYLLACIFGLLTLQGFAPTNLPVLTMLGLVGLWWLWDKSTTWRQAANIGFAFGVGLFAVGVQWMHLSLGVYGGVPIVVAWLVVAVFVMILSLFPAFAGGVAVRFKSALPLWAWTILLLPALWVLAEWLRIIIWTGFPWLLMGYTHMDTWLVGWAPITGTLGVSMAVTMSAGLLYWMIKTNNWIAGALIYGVLWGVSGQLAQQTWVSAKGDATPVGLVHGQVSELVKWKEDALPQLLQNYQQATAPLTGQTKVILWPETAIPTFLDRVMPVLDDFSAFLRASDAQVITGVALREDSIGGRQYYNSIASLDGGVRYDKRHLVPFSEFYPGFAVLAWFAKYLGMPMAQFSFGETPHIQTIAGHQVAMGVCYEADFGSEMARQTAVADWWLIVSDDGWFHPSNMAEQHWQMTRMRAVELGRDIVRVTNQGISGVAHPNNTDTIVGRPDDAMAGHLVKVQTYSGTTPYVDWQEMPLLSVLSFIFALTFMRWRRLQKSDNTSTSLNENEK